MSSENDSAEKRKELQQLLKEMDSEEVLSVLDKELDSETKTAIADNNGKAAPRGRPWKPGESGNPSGRPKNQFSFAKQFRKSFNLKASALEPTKLRAAELGIDPDSITIGELYAASMITESLKGRDSIAKEIINRLDGKVPDIIIADVVPTGLSKLSNEKLKELATKAFGEMDDEKEDQ